MKFEKDKTPKKFGKNIGYLVAYFIFTTILYFVLKFFDKIPESWTYFHVMGITLIIAVVGYILGRLLKWVFLRDSNKGSKILAMEFQQ